METLINLEKILNQNILGIQVKWVLLFAIFFLFLYIRIQTKRRRVIKKLKKLTKGKLELTPDEFFKMRNERVSYKYVSSSYRFPGVYILHNKTKKMYYVGQAEDVIFRINQHFTGHGNGDVYADYKYGDKFTIKTIPLKGSGYITLDELEKDTIEVYDAFEHGYNRNRGNEN